MFGSDLWRQLGYALRHRVRFTRAGFLELPSDFEAFWTANPSLKAEHCRLVARYPQLAEALPRMSILRARENLNVLAALDQLGGPTCGFDKGNSDPVRVLEVGVKNWATVDALVAFVHAKVGNHYLADGIELDPWRLYAHGHSRWDAMCYFSDAYSNCRPLIGDVRKLAGQYDLIVAILPFVFPEPHAAWGLPNKLFQPEAFFGHLVVTLLRPGGHLFLVNQGEAETEAQQALLAPHGLETQFAGILSQPFYPFRYARYGWHVQKP